MKGVGSVFVQLGVLVFLFRFSLAALPSTAFPTVYQASVKDLCVDSDELLFCTFLDVV